MKEKDISEIISSLEEIHSELLKIGMKIAAENVKIAISNAKSKQVFFDMDNYYRHECDT